MDGWREGGVLPSVYADSLLGILPQLCLHFYLATSTCRLVYVPKVKVIFELVCNHIRLCYSELG